MIGRDGKQENWGLAFLWSQQITTKKTVFVYHEQHCKPVGIFSGIILLRRIKKQRVNYIAGKVVATIYFIWSDL